MSLIKIVDIDHVRFSCPDLRRMRTFLEDFGLRDAGSDETTLRMRAAGTSPFAHVTEKGPAGFRGVGLRAASRADLETLAAHDGTAVESSSAPGGGFVVRLVDPDGFSVHVVAEQTAPPTAPLSGEDWNTALVKGRPGMAKRLGSGPSRVLRLGHVVLVVSDLDATWRWWQERFGLIISDDVRAPDGAGAALFVRCDRGDALTDHHTLNFSVVPGKEPQFHHAAFEVLDLDDLMVGHDHLLAMGYRPSWGIGRHILGSQIFDYWLDPFGHRVEHWTDGDLFAADAPTNVADIATMLGHQWGPSAPADFV
jgi:catechol 2,3-dioxygenase-like lactoylglutathione lyase family enzyme